MNFSVHEIGLEALDGLQNVEALCLFVRDDERPLRGIAGFVDWRLCGALSRVLLDGFFTGSPGEHLLCPTEGRVPMGRIFMVGLGKGSSLAGDGLGKALAAAARMLNRAKVDSVVLEVPGSGLVPDETRAQALAHGFLKEVWAQRVAVVADKSLKPLVTVTGRP